jgi:hypothetical protein
MYWIAIPVALALVAAAWFWLRSRARSEPSSSRAGRPAERFAAVVIRTRSGACKAARALDGKRFLANKSPTLPLGRCTTKHCACTFEKMPDRRGEDRRFTVGSLNAAMFLKSERRRRAGRRNAD